MTERSVRHIYKGDVPFIYNESAHDKKAACGTQHCFRFRPFEAKLETHPTDVVPITVQRQSIRTVNGPPTVENFPDNSIVTSRYTAWNFLPKNLFEQFRRIVNFYFLVGAFIHSVIDSPVHPITAVSPLTFVILVTAIKQGYEDWLRHKNDDNVNNRIVKVIRNGELMEIKSKKIQVGDIIKLESDEQVPTDILLLGSSDEYLRCELNTANLDGETNLKLRYCPSGLPRFKSVEDFDNLHLIVECENPCEDLYEFNGSLLIPASKLSVMHKKISLGTKPANNPGTSSDQNGIKESGDQHQEIGIASTSKEHDDILTDFRSGLIRQGVTDFLSIPLSMENMVLRGTRLKNTNFIYGIVIYTGKDTRLARNSEKSEAKFSTVESAVNYYLLFFIILLLFLVIFCTVMHYAVNWFADAPEEGPWYAMDDEGILESDLSVRRILNTVASFIVLFNYIIPISLYVTVELQKFLGSMFFVWDQDMIDEEGKEPLCNTSDLNEELGQIEYLFSDKTGTLTQNVMKFRHCSISASLYEYKTDHKLVGLSSLGTINRNDDSKVVDVLRTPDVLNFFKTLALCHSVQVVAKRRHSLDVPKSLPELRILTEESSAVTAETHELGAFYKDGTWEFQASSPDEKALLEACESIGILYRGEMEDVMSLEIFGNIEKYKRLMHLEFDADRKCMSVIVENSRGEIWLLSKGAESSIIPKCDHGPTHETLKHVMDYALMGLRTLAVAVRKLTRREYEEFAVELNTARRLLKNRQASVREVYSSIESHMSLIGATGVEDQLQKNVPETLQALGAAGIRIWMLTGDKLETGVNVAISCGLITASTKQYILNKTEEADGVIQRLTQIKDLMDTGDNTCFVVDGDSLALAFKECPDLLREVSMAVFRVVCCRMAPLQKAQVVQMVKNSPEKPTCCAVGDGANDCAMILAAHIGIGILGKEGRQAARCADFAVAKFGFLKKAILVHGHWYYIRLANLANYFFYKNVVFVLPQFFFSFTSNFSTQAIFNGLFLMNYNICFASLPILIYGLTEQDYSARTLMDQPHLYKKNRKNSLMTIKQFTPWFVSALWHAVVSYYLPYFAWGNFDQINDVMTYGTVVFSGVVLTTNLKMAIETNFVSWYYVGSQMVSFGAYFVFTSIYSEVDFRGVGFTPSNYHHVYFTTFSSICFWLLMLLVAVTAITPDITFSIARRFWRSAKKFSRF